MTLTVIGLNFKVVVMFLNINLNFIVNLNNQKQRKYKKRNVYYLIISDGNIRKLVINIYIQHFVEVCIIYKVNVKLIY